METRMPGVDAEMAGITYCHECKKVLAETSTKEEARKKAVLHMSMTPHILVFGYSASEFIDPGQL